MAAVIFLVFFTLAFAAVAGWQDREEAVGGEPRKAITVTLFAVGILVFLFLVAPR